MKIVIVEDEFTARENLKIVLKNIDPEIEIVGEVDSIAEAVDFFRSHSNIDLAIFDIELADGSSFEIFKQTEVKVPVIFTTAYNQYAIDAFKVDSVDYLLKPIVQSELKAAIEKYKKRFTPTVDYEALYERLRSLARPPTYKKHFLIEQGNNLLPLRVIDIAYFFIENEVVRCKSFNGNIFYLRTKLEDIDEQVDPDQFYRANRQFIVNRNAITKVSLYFNGRLLLHVQPEHNAQILISKARATEFKNWMA